jgi:ATP-dependent DNA helicase RecQ
MPATTKALTTDSIIRVVQEYWGFDALREHQERAIRAGHDGQDSLVVMPTGGGKSLCYQVPPLLLEKPAVVVSPLISLMKDQVDGLNACGYPAAALNSTLDPIMQDEIEEQFLRGELRLLFLAPERLLTSRTLALLKEANVTSFAIDEAHCISHWGHDFRPEYRRLAELRTFFPDASLHAFTATATERVRRDIVKQLGLRDAELLVGRCDRANLTYRVVSRTDVRPQALEVIRRHQGQAVIIYCLSRKDTERLAEWLSAQGVDAKAYHAGMDATKRRRVQDAFSTERLDVVVATVAFGMGIDRSDVRCVVHATMPKSVEHYQQETGRAGRDGLDAECVLLYSGADGAKWRSLMQRSADQEAFDLGYDQPEDGRYVAGDPRAALADQFRHLSDMERFASAGICRHQALSEYFGQPYEPGTVGGLGEQAHDEKLNEKPDQKTDETAAKGCGACDVCLNEIAYMEGGTVIAQQILSCIYRVDQHFGATHVTDVLAGSNTEKIRQFNHDQLSTHGLMKDFPKTAIRQYLEQLIALNLIVREGEFHMLRLTADARAVLKGDQEVRLVEVAKAKPRRQRQERTRRESVTLEGIEQELFEVLRVLRREIALERSVPPFVIFSDYTLTQMATLRPGELEGMLSVSGIGRAKQDSLGKPFFYAIDAFCRENNLSRDTTPQAPAAEEYASVSATISDAKDKAAKLFSQGQPIDRVAESIGRAPSTTAQYLVDWVEQTSPADVSVWVDDSTYQNVIKAWQACDSEGSSERLRPVFEKLEERVTYEQIRIVVAHCLAQQNA